MMPDLSSLFIFAMAGVGAAAGCVIGLSLTGIAFLISGVVSAAPIAIGAVVGLCGGYVIGRMATSEIR